MPIDEKQIDEASQRFDEARRAVGVLFPQMSAKKPDNPSIKAAPQLETTPRAKRFFGALAVTLGLIFAACFVEFMFVFVSAFAFIGSTGHAHNLFVAEFDPAFHFIDGATVAGGVLVLVNSICADHGWWWRTTLVAAAVGGGMAVAIPTIGTSLASLTQPVMWLVAAIFIHK